jgi:uncharacterized protein DUF4956/MgtC family protein
VTRHPSPGAWLKLAAVVVLLAVMGAGFALRAQSPLATAEELSSRGLDVAQNVAKELTAAAIRLPLAAVLGAMLAWRPRRVGTPRRRAAVVETQIVLAVVGALIMLVVGASLARAFGIVGVASLIRYRSKISDPKDAVVMLCALAVGLASGSGLFALAVFSTLFLFAVLWFVEGFERPVRVYELTAKFGEGTGELRTRVERLLRQYETSYELRGISEDKASFLVKVPSGANSRRLARDLAALAIDGKGSVEWTEKTKPLA